MRKKQVTLELDVLPNTVKSGTRVYLFAHSRNTGWFTEKTYSFCLFGGPVFYSKKNRTWIDTSGLPKGKYVVEAHLSIGITSLDKAYGAGEFEVI